MAIERDDVLLAPGVYELEDRARTPAGLTDRVLRKDDYSLHHILPYRYPAFAGFVIEAFRERFVPEAQRPGWPGSATDERSARVAEILGVVGKFGPLQARLQSQFAWMGPNLFQGPSGNFRLDDPKSQREPNRPQSIPIAVWDALLDLGVVIDSLAILVADDGYQAKVKRPIRVKDFDALLWRLTPLVGAGRSNAHKFQPQDWICLVSSGPSFKLKPHSTVTGAFLEKFRNFVRLQPDMVERYKPTKLQYRPWRPVVWRLRLKDEDIPMTEFQSPALQP